jgi:hypothetical protein
MKVLYVVGTNLNRNTSANISHNAYVKGLLENNCEVDIVMASSSWGEKDTSLRTFKEANYFTFNSVSIGDKLRTKFKKIFYKKRSKDSVLETTNSSDFESAHQKDSLKLQIRSYIKLGYDFVFRTSKLYYLDKIWLKNASSFRTDIVYDLVISNSSPASSHKLVSILLEKNQIKETRWIQIWEDPWFFDIYADHNEKIKKEEHRLLRSAQEIFYVSILTLKYQKEHFPDCASKMKHIPLPYLKFGKDEKVKDPKQISFGYFGDYYSITRNLNPFYESLVKSKAKGFIFGDSDLSLKSTELVAIGRRITLEKVAQLRNQSSVLVHLCNLKGGQIPGKIYHYSATHKPILFILDGTLDEINVIKSYFEKYKRYHFCENKMEAILKIIDSFLNGKENLVEEPVLEFSPKNVIAELLKSH